MISPGPGRLGVAGAGHPDNVADRITAGRAGPGPPSVGRDRRHRGAGSTVDAQTRHQTPALVRVWGS